MCANKMPYRLSPLAEADLEEIWLYTLRQWSLEQADIYHRNIIRTIEGLASGRTTWHKTKIRAGYWKYPVGKHVIFFQHPEGFLDVIRILHERMDIERQLDVATPPIDLA